MHNNTTDIWSTLAYFSTEGMKLPTTNANFSKIPIQNQNRVTLLLQPVVLTPESHLKWMPKTRQECESAVASCGLFTPFC